MVAYLVVYGRDPTDRFAVHRFPDRGSALAARLTPSVPVDGYGRYDESRTAHVGVGGCAYVIETEEDAEKIGQNLRIAIYRELTGARSGFRTVSASWFLETLTTASVSSETKSEMEITMPDTDSTPRGRHPRFEPDQRIQILATENPKKVGKKNHDRFAALMALPNPTVARAVAAGVTYGDLAYDQEKGYLRVLPLPGAERAAAE